MARSTRRDLLQGMTAAAGVAACNPGKSGGGLTGSDSGTGGGTTDTSVEEMAPLKIDNIVIVMMENRSFDHAFGSLSLLEGRTDIDGLVAGMSNPDLGSGSVGIGPTTHPCVHPDPPHGWDTSRDQFNNGANDGFVRAMLERYGAGSEHLAMEYLTRELQSHSYAIAESGAICQRWFSSLLTSTWPNRLYLHSASSQGVGTNRLPEGSPTYSIPTIWDQLSAAGVDWGYYFSDLPALALYGNEDFNGHVDVISRFFIDCELGLLPPVVCLEPAATFNDDHPPHHPQLGQLFIGQIYEALRNSVHWENSLFVVCYDEAGGFYDHVPPPTMPDEHAAEGFDQLGFRVPAFVAGPWVKPGQVSDIQFTHESVLRTVQRLHGIDEMLNIRNEAANDLLPLLDLEAMAADTPHPPAELTPIPMSEDEIEMQCANAGKHCGQPELEKFVNENCPKMNRRADINPAWARKFFQRAGESGLWVPKSRGLVG